MLSLKFLKKEVFDELCSSHALKSAAVGVSQITGALGARADSL